MAFSAGTRLVVAQVTQMCRASNVKAKRELAWKPTYPNWREGSRAGLGWPSRSAVQAAAGMQAACGERSSSESAGYMIAEA
jgi:hypothetical protein